MHCNSLAVKYETIYLAQKKSRDRLHIQFTGLIVQEQC